MQSSIASNISSASNILHFTLLRGNDHSQESEENQIFDPIQTSDDNENGNFVDNGNIFECLDNDEKFFENIGFEDDSDISSVFIEKPKSNCDDNVTKRSTKTKSSGNVTK